MEREQLGLEQKHELIYTKAQIHRTTEISQTHTRRDLRLPYTKAETHITTKISQKHTERYSSYKERDLNEILYREVSREKERGRETCEVV